MNDIDRFKPLADSVSAVEIGDLEVTNDEAAIVLSGSLRLEPDAQSVERARSLARLFERAATALEKAISEGRKAPERPTDGRDEFGLPL